MPTVPDLDLLAADRPDLAELSAEQIAPIESRTQGWPDSWRDFARSLYITLTSREQPLESSAAASLAVDLLLGIVIDMPGAQPYIAAGRDIRHGAKARRVMELLRRYRQDYDRVGKLMETSPRTVRRIEALWLRAERTRRQCTLDFE
jgi:hypothetical protein